VTKFIQLIAPAGRDGPLLALDSLGRIWQFSKAYGVDEGNGSGPVHEGWELSPQWNTRCEHCRG
jgi:hypothetical protein